MVIREADIRSLKPYEKNAKRHDAQQIANVANSIRRFGWQQPLVIDENNVVVIGHCRLLAAKKLGLKTVPVTIASGLTEDEIRELRIADNKTNESPWDMELLAQDLEGLDFEGFDFDFSGAETPEEDPDVEDDEYDKPIPEDPVSRPGQLWQLGDHRLLIGDSTREEDVAELMGGAFADLLLTDPPYNVDYTGGTDDAMKIENDHMEDAAFLEFLTAAMRNADTAMRPGAAYYIWHADSEGYNFRQSIRNVGWRLRQCLVWVKNTLVLGRQDYQWRHEPCLYGWKDGAHYFTDDRKQTTVVDEQPDLKKLPKEKLIAMLEEILGENTPQTVMYEDKPLRNLLHHTMKPVTLMGRMVRNSTKRGDIVLDLFAGSGSTMIACEQLGRRAFMMEMDPRYADSILDRYCTFTGKKAVLIHE